MIRYWVRIIVDNKMDSMNHNLNSHLPWVELFRPKNIDEIVSNDNIRETLKNYLEQGFIPHLLFHGPPGTGKTSMIRAFAKALYGDNYSMMVMDINASEERGIEVVRTKIKQFVITKCPIYNVSKSPFKLVILDEADSMTSDAQSMLRRVIENHTENARFCLLCNKIKNIDPAIQSRCTIFRFAPLTDIDIENKIKEIIKIKNIKTTSSGINMIIKIAKGDMRKVLNILQSTSMAYATVNESAVVNCVGYPDTSDIELLYDTLTTKKYNDAYDEFKNIKDDKGYSLLEIMTELQSLIIQKYLENRIDNEQFVINACSKLKQIEMILIGCPNDNTQIGGIVASFILHR